MAVRDQKLRDYITRHELVKPIELEACVTEVEITKERLGKALVKNGFIDQDTLINALVEVTDDALFDEELIVPHVPADILWDTQTKIVALTVKTVYIATMSSENEVRYRLERYFQGLNIKFTPANLTDIENYLDKLTGLENSEETVLENLLHQSVVQSASDIHIEPKTDSYTVFFRVLGERSIVYEGTLDEHMSLVSRIKDKCGMDIAERRIDQDGKFSYEYNGRIIDLRVVTIPMREGEKVVIRLLDPKNANKKLTDLGISNLKAWRQGTSLSSGLCLICGPTGSGKTTTLNATTRHLDRFGKCIGTIEDPVEYSIPYVTQINVNELIGLTFARGVRAFMRGDPDVIIVGEIRDIETARNALKAAETGHLVIGTLHTESIRGAIDRLRDIGVEAHELKQILRAIMVQRLMKVICKTCYGENPDCPHCFGRGYSSRTIVSEANYFKSFDDVKRLLTTDDIWWENMAQDAYNQYARGDTDIREMYRVFGVEGTDLVLENGMNERDKALMAAGKIDMSEYE